MLTTSRQKAAEIQNYVKFVKHQGADITFADFRRHFKLRKRYSVTGRPVSSDEPTAARICTPLELLLFKADILNNDMSEEDLLQAVDNLMVWERPQAVFSVVHDGVLLPFKDLDDDGNVKGIN